jgi:hypothetical protein
MQKRIRVWLGIGSAALVGGLGGAAVAGTQGKLGPEVPGHGAHLMLAQGGEGGEEGGERGDEVSAVAVDPDRALATNLLLMKGHLRVGDALVRMGRWSEALPHFLHPIEELYGEVRDQLDQRDLPPFGDALELLGRTVRRQGDLALYEQRLKEVSARIDAALQGVPEGRRQEPGFVAAVATDLLGTAAEEYGAAFEDDKLVNVVEYQDSLGFVQEAKALLEAHQARFTGEDAERLAEIRRHLAALEAAWPGVVPPEAPAMTPGEVLALASSIELAASGVR